MGRGALEGIVLAQAIISVISDFTFAALPILFLWRVQVDLTTKAGLWLLMCLGFITGSFCLVRTVLNNESIPLDATYNGIVNWVWRLFEVQIGIIAACIPTLRPLYTWIMRRFRGDRKALDENIRFPLSHHKQNGWTEDVENARGSGSDEESGGEMRESSAREQLGVQDILMAERRSHSSDRRDTRKDTMRDELVGEGIVDPAATNRTDSPSQPAAFPSKERKDIQRYKIGDELSSEGMAQKARRIRGASPAGSRGSRSREEKDTMRDELISEGIVKPGATTRNTSSPQLAMESGPLSPLGEEMQRFGIDASLNSIQSTT